jgi:hypothetical protein
MKILKFQKFVTFPPASNMPMYLCVLLVSVNMLKVSLPFSYLVTANTCKKNVMQSVSIDQWFPHSGSLLPGRYVSRDS